jgi:hypothetical protein
LFGKGEEEETISYTINVVDGQGTGTYQKGVSVTIVADSIEGKSFAYWMVGDTELSKDATYTFTATKDMEITAVFVDSVELFEVTTTNTQGYVTEGLGDYQKDSIVTVRAKTGNNLVFLYWDFDGVNVSNNPTYHFTIKKNVVVTPVYDVYSFGLVFEYSQESDSYIVTGYEKDNTYSFDMLIPEYYNDGTNGLKYVTQIKEEALMSTYFMKKVTIGKAVITIGNRAFADCKDLVDVVLPESLTSIGEQAFFQCFIIKEITLPKNVSIIASDAFSNTSELETILVDSENNQFKSIDGVLLSKDGSILYRFPQKKGGLAVDYVIPASVTSIKKDAFNRVYLRNVTFGNTAILQISEYAFAESGIKNIAIPKSVETIGNHAFYNNQNLDTITFAYESNLKTIGGYAFYSCTSLGNISLPDGIETIENNAFEDCTNLKTTLKLAITKIGSAAFKNCGYFIDLFITDTITYIGEDAFVDTDTFGNIYIASDIVIRGLTETAYGGLAKGDIYITDSFIGTLPDYIQNNYTKGVDKVSQSGRYFYKYTKNIDA